MSVVAKISLDASGFKAGAEVVKKTLSGLTSAAKATGSAMASGVSWGIEKLASIAKKSFAGVVAIATGMGVGVWEAMSEGGELVDLQEQTGVAIDTLMALRVGFEQAGLGAEEVQPTIARLQKTIVGAQTGSESAQRAFEALGLSADELAKMTADQQLQAVGEAVAGIQNPALKSAVAMEVFGKSGARMLSLFAAGGLDEASAAIGKQADLMAKYADTFDGITDAFGLYQTKLRGFFVGVAAELAPILKLAADWFKKLDFAQIGQQVGESIAVIYELFRQEKIGKLLSASMKLGFAESINYLWATLKATWAGASKLFSASFDGLNQYFSNFGKLLMAAGKTFAGFLMQAVSAVFRSMSELPVIGKTMFAASQRLGKSGDDLVEKGVDSLGAAAKSMENALPSPDEFVAKMKEAGKAFGEEFKKSKKLKLIDTDVESAKLKKLYEEGKVAADAAQAGLGAVKREEKAPVIQQDLLDILGPQKLSRPQQTFGMFGSVGGGVVRGTFQTFDPMIQQQKISNQLLKVVAENTTRGNVAVGAAYQR